MKNLLKLGLLFGLFFILTNGFISCNNGLSNYQNDFQKFWTDFHEIMPTLNNKKRIGKK